MIRNNSGRKRTRSDPDGAVLLNSVSTNKKKFFVRIVFNIHSY